MPAAVDLEAAPYVYGVLEESGGTTIGHLDGGCRAITGRRVFIPRRLQPDHDRDSWPCCRCVSLEQLDRWNELGRAAASLFPPEQKKVPQELKGVPSAADNLYSGVHGNQPPETLEDTTMNTTTINRSNDLTAEILEGLKNAFATAARYGVEGVEDMRQATLACYRAGDLTAELALDLTDTYVAAAQVKAQVAADQRTPKQAGQPVVCENKAPAGTTGPAFEKGMIVTNAAGQIVRVYVSKTGNLYGKVRDGYGTWEYAPGAMKGARHLTAEEARAYGVTEERCVFCATKIETKESLAVGYGPDCAEKYGLPWG